VLISNSRAPLADVAHRFDGVDDQVKKHLFHLNSIPLNAWQALSELRLHRDLVLRHFAADQGDHLADCFVGVEGLFARWRLPEEISDPVDEVVGPITGLDNASERRLCLVQVWRLAA